MEEELLLLQEISDKLSAISEQLYDLNISNKDIIDKLDDLQKDPDDSLYDVCFQLKQLQGSGTFNAVSDVYDAVSELSDVMKYK